MKLSLSGYSKRCVLSAPGKDVDSVRVLIVVESKLVHVVEILACLRLADQNFRNSGLVNIVILICSVDRMNISIPYGPISWTIGEVQLNRWPIVAHVVLTALIKRA